jgi:sucrose-phosphate synthase
LRCIYGTSFRYAALVNGSPDTVGFGLSTGRSKESALKVLEQQGIVKPQLLIASVGTEIYYGEKLLKDDSWGLHIAYKSWEPEKIQAALQDIPGLKLQNIIYQTKFKISYLMDTAILKKKSTIKKVLRTNKIKARVIFSQGYFLDIIPLRSGDGLALRHVSFKWGIPLNKILIAGNSGNDETMLKGETLGVVVRNYSKELEKLKSFPRVYFAQKESVQGLIEGIKYYNFFGNIQIPNNFYDK